MSVQDNAAETPGQTDQTASKPYISPSQIDKYLRCGESYRRHYVENERFPPVLAMLKGTGMHGAAHVNFAQKIESHEDLPLPQIIEAAVAAFDAELQKSGVQLRDEETALGKATLPNGQPGEYLAIGKARDEVKKLATGFATMQAPHYQPIATELKVRIPVKRGPRDILGVLDLVATIDGQPGNRVRDFKNSARKKSQLDAAESTQLTTYGAAHQVHFGEPAVDVGLDVLILREDTPKKKGGVERQELVDTRDTDDFKALANTLNAVEAGITAGIFLPSLQSKSAWWCSDKFCPYHASCPFVNAKRVNAALQGDGE